MESSRPGVHFSRETDTPPGRGGKKGDVYQLVCIFVEIDIFSFDWSKTLEVMATNLSTS